MNAPAETDVAVRPMAPGDVPEAREIDRRAFGRPGWPLATSDLDRTDRCHVVATIGGEVVGYADALVATGTAQVLTVAVAPERQRRGVGGHLLAGLEAELTARGCDEVTLEVRVGNRAALALYRRAGYAVVGERPRYYPDGEDALVMRKG